MVMSLIRPRFNYDSFLPGQPRPSTRTERQSEKWQKQAFYATEFS